MSNFDKNKYCSAMCYYLNHIKLDLSFGRVEFFRHFADHVGAMMSGFTTIGAVYKGNWKKFKITCYASTDALKAIKQSERWDTTGKGITMEHVVPINVIGTELLKLYTVNPLLTCNEILQVIRHLLIPCLITKVEDASLSKFSDSMPDYWKYAPKINNQWERYLQTPSPVNPLFNDIVAIAPPAWMIKQNSPLFPPNREELPAKLMAQTNQTGSCDCLNLLDTGLSSDCMERQLLVNVL